MTKHVIVKLTQYEANGISWFFENFDANGGKIDTVTRRGVMKINKALEASK